MIERNRRTFVRMCGMSVSIFFAGCNGHRGENSEIDPVLDFFAQVEQIDAGWELTARARNTSTHDSSIHDITLLAFSDTGEKICQADVGDLIRNGEPDRTVTVTCERFPAIITGTAAETPCDGSQIEILYWVGNDEQRGADLPNDVTVWEDTYRKCDEPLPPDRVLENVNSNGTASNDD